MQVLRSKDHFILNQNLKINFLKWGILFVSLISTLSLKAAIKIVFLDTGFCPLEKKNLFIVHPVEDTSGEVGSLECPPNFNSLPRFHGQKVLETFVKNYKGKKKIEVFPIVVFDKNGFQKDVYWEKAFSKIDYIKPDVVISAVGLVNQQITWRDSIKSVWFLSAARVSPRIKNSDIVFPQNHYLKNNVFLFGSYFEGNIIDPGQIDIDKIKLFALDPKDDFNGSSYAVAKISSEILSKCDLKKLDEKCFNKLSKDIKGPHFFKK